MLASRDGPSFLGYRAVKAASQAAGLSPQAVRLREAKVLPPTERTDADVDVLRFIRPGQGQ